MENNEINREKLARSLVNGWDLDSLVYYAIESLQQLYTDCDDTFKSDWKNCFDEEEVPNE